MQKNKFLSNKKIKLIFILFLLFIIENCSTTEIKTHYRLNSDTINAPIPNNTIKITDNNNPKDSIFSFSISQSHEKNTKVRILEDNERWTLPNNKIILNYDFIAENHIALNCGVFYSKANKKDLFGGNVGFGIYNESKNFGFRFDPAIYIQEVDFGANITKTTEVWTDGVLISSSSDTIIENNIRTRLGYSLTFTVNLKKNIMGIKPFASFDILWYHYLRTDNGKFRHKSTFFAFTPGIYIDLDNNNRLISGVRLTKERGNRCSTPYEYFLQYNLKMR